LAATLMRYILPMIIATLLLSCFNSSTSFEKDYYERITGIKFPKDYEVLETFDNMEFLTGTVFKIDTVTLRSFVNRYNFQMLTELRDLQLVSVNYLRTYKPSFASTSNIFFIRESKEKNHWTYVADLNRGELWAEIWYPDSGQ